MSQIKNACLHLGIDENQVMSHKVYDDDIVLVVDYGIAGGKKHKIPLADLEVEIKIITPSIEMTDYKTKPVLPKSKSKRGRPKKRTI